MNARKFDLVDIATAIHEHTTCARVCDTLHRADLKYKLAPEILATALFEFGIDATDFEDRIEFACSTWDVIVKHAET